MTAQFPPLPPRPVPQHHDHDQIHVPREVVYLTIGFIGLCLVLIMGARMTDIGTTHEDPAALRPVASFTVAGAGRIGEEPAPALVATEADGRRIVLAGVGEEEFPRLMIRGLLTLRERRGIDAALPISLEVDANGQRLLVDPQTGYAIRLAAFGPENGHSFDTLLPRKAP